MDELSSESGTIHTIARRKYEQRLRAEAAEETRRRIVEALYERLREAPTQAVSVEEVARLAGVARSTVYLIFGSRAGLFDALARDLVEGSGYDRILEAVRHPDARAQLRGGLVGSVEMYAANRDVFRVLFSMTQLDPDAVGGAVQRLEQRRADGMASLAEQLASKGALRPDVGIGEAAHVAWLLTSFDAFDLLYTGRGLPADEVARVLLRTAERALCR
jgi:AcrR family transcriptional regulator